MKTNALAGVMMAAALLGQVRAPAPAEPSSRDIQVVRDKINSAQDYVAKTWSRLMQSQGVQFSAPPLIVYTGSIESRCGRLGAGNAQYCITDKKIYMDAAFLAQLMEAAARTLGTDGDYAPIAVMAHEFGHAVDQALATAPKDSHAMEQAADCFAGVLTRQAKSDRLLEEGDLAEGLFALALVGDDAGLDPVDWRAQIQRVVEIYNAGQTHGGAKARQAAFLHGYYGGPSYCNARFGAPKPPSAEREIASIALSARQTLLDEPRQSCRWSNEPTGLRVNRPWGGGGEDCRINLLPAPTILPDHLRIELTATRVNNADTKLGSAAGIYYGDARSTTEVTHYGFETDSSNNALLVNMDRGFVLIGTDQIYGMYKNWDKINATGENRLTLDIHHEGKNVYFMEYVNGYEVGFGQWRGSQPKHKGANDQAGLWVHHNGAEAIFKNFRVMMLPD